MTHSPHFLSIPNLAELNKVVDGSREKPVLVFKHHPSTKQSIEKKMELETTWDLTEDMVDLYLINDSENIEVSTEICEIAGIPNEAPQIILFADGVTMYDESGDMISVKKIKLALKIVNRTFKWMETRA